MVPLAAEPVAAKLTSAEREALRLRQRGRFRAGQGAVPPQSAPNACDRRLLAVLAALQRGWTDPAWAALAHPALSHRRRRALLRLLQRWADALADAGEILPWRSDVPDRPDPVPAAPDPAPGPPRPPLAKPGSGA